MDCVSFQIISTEVTSVDATLHSRDLLSLPLLNPYVALPLGNIVSFIVISSLLLWISAWKLQHLS